MLMDTSGGATPWRAANSERDARRPSKWHREPKTLLCGPEGREYRTGSFGGEGTHGSSDTYPARRGGGGGKVGRSIRSTDSVRRASGTLETELGMASN